MVPRAQVPAWGRGGGGLQEGTTAFGHLGNAEGGDIGFYSPQSVVSRQSPPPPPPLPRVATRWRKSSEFESRPRRFVREHSLPITSDRNEIQTQKLALCNYNKAVCFSFLFLFPFPFSCGPRSVNNHLDTLDCDLFGCMLCRTQVEN